MQYYYILYSGGEKNMTKPWIVDDAGTLINMETRETYDYVSELVDELNKQEERINNMQQIIDTIAKDYEESHGMDIRNAEWFTAW